MSDELSPIQAEAQFIEQTAAKYEAAASAAADPPAPAAPVAPSAQEPAASTEAAPVVKTPNDTPAEPTPDDDAPDQAEAPDDDTADAEPVDDEPDGLSEEFKAAAKAHKLPLTLDDLPEEARPIVQKRIKELESGFTKAQQDARSYRQDEAKYRAEEKFRTDHPELAVIEMITKQPALLDKINAHLAKIYPTADGPADAAQAELVATAAKSRRGEALTAVEQQQNAGDWVAKRGNEIESYAKTAALKAGVPFELGIPEAIAAKIYAKPDDQRDITNAEIDEIVRDKAKHYTNHVRAHRREASKTAVVQRTNDRRTATPAVRSPGGTSIPTPAAKPMPKNDDEFTASFTQKLRGANGR